MYPKGTRPPWAPITVRGNDPMKLSLGPLQYFWKRDDVFRFYRQAANWPVAAIYLGETVCSKRREMRLDDWLELAEALVMTGHDVVLSSLALMEAESELSALHRMAANGRFRIEANDLSAVQLCREHGVPFVAGPTLNLYNHESLALLRTCGMYRFVLGIEQGEAALLGLREGMARSGHAFPEVEVLAWGRLPLAYSARCFTARARNLGKDECGFSCLADPQGLLLETREQQPFLCLNGVQVQSAACCDLGPDLESLRRCGVDYLRISPQPEGTEAVVERFHQALTTRTAPPRLGDCNGYWHGMPGMDWIDAARQLSSDMTEAP